MYELIQLSPHDYYIDCPAKMGLVQCGENEVVLIDSGNDKDAGKKALRLLESKGWHLKAIFNTHSHADHIGGNHFLQEKTGCAIYAPEGEYHFVNFPLLEPMGLYGGLPLPDLKHKFLMAQESRAEKLTAEVLPEGMTLLPLPGHSLAMTGFLTADGNAFIGDCVSSEETLKKYGLGYLWDPEAFVDTLERVKALNAIKFIPAHAPVTENIAPLAQVNIDAVQAAANKIAALCGQGTTFDELLKKVFDTYGMTLNISQYALIGSTVRSYLTCLAKQGQVEYFFENNRMLWRGTITQKE